MLSLNYVPRPFGSLEPFLQHMPIRELGIFLVATAILALSATHVPKIFRKWPWIIPLAAVPQQGLLIWGVAWAILTLLSEPDARTWYGCSYQTVLAVFHGLSLYGMYKVAILKAEVNGNASK